MKSAVVTGVSGQDGAYLSKNLLEKGYRVFGAFRRTSSRGFWRLEEMGVLDNQNFTLIENDVTDLSSCIRLLKLTLPSEVYNLAAQSYVAVSFDQPITTSQVTGLGALNILEAIRLVNPGIKFYQASTSEMFGKVTESPQSERTDFYPRSPYGVAKLFAHWTTINYRESYSIFAASGILFNHESSLRGSEFVTRKITQSVARLSLGSQEILELGNLNAQRDWGHAEEYVEGMWRMLQTQTPETFVLASGKATSVRDFTTLAFAAAGIEVAFDGEGVDEVGRDQSSGKELVRVRSSNYRPAEVDLLLGDASKAEELLGWRPKISVEQLCEEMVEADIKRELREHRA